MKYINKIHREHNTRGSEVNVSRKGGMGSSRCDPATALLASVAMTSCTSPIQDWTTQHPMMEWEGLRRFLSPPRGSIHG